MGKHIRHHAKLAWCLVYHPKGRGGIGRIPTRNLPSQKTFKKCKGSKSIHASFSGGGTALLLTPGIGNTQACRGATTRY